MKYFNRFENFFSLSINSIRINKRFFVLSLIGILILELLAYHKIWYYTFTFLDDSGIHLVPWTHPYSVDGLNKGIFLYLMGVGRPIVTILFYLVELIAAHISMKDLWIYYLFSLIGIGCVAAIFASELEKTLNNKILAFVAAGLSVLAPHATLYTVYCNIFYQPLAGLLSYASFRCLLHYLNNADKTRWKHLFLAIVLIVAAHWIHQPLAFFGFLISLIYLFRSDILFQERIKIVLSSAVVSMIGLIASAAFAWISLSVRGAHLERFTLTQEPFERIIWFLSGPLPISASNILLSTHWFFSLLILIMIVLCVSLQSIKLSHKIIMTMLLLIGVPWCYAANLAAAEPFVFVRSMAILVFLCLMFYAIALDKLMLKFTNHTLIKLALFLLLIPSVLSAHKLHRYITLPPQVEVSSIREALDRFNINSHTRITVLRPNQFNWKIIASDVAIPNGIIEYAMSDLVRVLLNDRYPHDPRINKIEMALETLPNNDPMIPKQEHDFVIDLRPTYQKIANAMNQSKYIA
jgi:hypothetical protein